MSQAATHSHQLASDLQGYAEWRTQLAGNVTKLREWLDAQELNDAQTDLRLQQLLERLGEDKLNVAFVAEFSRGKSELINAIFFADYGQRLLPSSAGRTTMCPTELLYDPEHPPRIQLLPIETRSSDATVGEMKKYPEEWQTLPLELDSAEKLAAALSQVSLTRRVSVDEARRLGLYRDDDEGAEFAVLDDGSVEVPAWRHAIINYPHPLLEKGLVILDTPGLNAIGTEPELTLNLLPNAHAVLFILAADTGVTKSDIEVWRNHIGGQAGGKKGRMVVLNKIDGLWDELKTQEEIDAEIQRQVTTSAELLGLPASQVFPISAQKALVAKVNGDDPLLAKSRLPALENALSAELIPAKQEIVSEMASVEIKDVTNHVNAILASREKGIAEQLVELRGLRGKNQDVIEHMMQKVRVEKDHFEKGLQRFQALRSVFSQQTNEVYTYLGRDSLKTLSIQVRQLIEDSALTETIRKGMADFFRQIKLNFDKAQGQVSEIHAMMGGMYEKFSAEHGLEAFNPLPFSMLKYQKEIDRVEKSFHDHFNTIWVMYASTRSTLEKKFFEGIVSRIKQVYKIANRDVDNWLKAVMAPMESQVREHQLQLRRRLESIKRIHKATDTLEDRIGELEHMEETLRAQLAEMEVLMAYLDADLHERQQTAMAMAA